MHVARLCTFSQWHIAGAKNSRRMNSCGRTGWQLFKLHRGRVAQRGRCVLPRHPYACGKTVIYHLPFEISESIYLLDSFFFMLPHSAPPSVVLFWHCMRIPMNQLHICWVRLSYVYLVLVPVFNVHNEWNKNNHWNNKKGVLTRCVYPMSELGRARNYAMPHRWSTRISAIKFICSCFDRQTTY